MTDNEIECFVTMIEHLSMHLMNAGWSVQFVDIQDSANANHGV